MNAISELTQFRDFLNRRFGEDSPPNSPEEALIEFRELAESPSERDECFAAVSESLNEIRRGVHGRLVSEYLADLRARHGFES